MGKVEGMASPAKRTHKKSVGAWGNTEESRDAIYMRKRAALISEAARAFHDRNFYEISMDEIADAVGVTKPTLYRYVQNKQEILYECHKRAMDCAEIAAKESTAAGGSALERVTKFVSVFVKLVLEFGGGASMLLYLDALPEQQRVEISKRREKWSAYVAALIKQGQKDGSIRGVDPMVATMFVMGSINWLNKWYRADGSLDANQVAETFSTLFASGLASKR
jgi:AcrR family transcriptional regulator